MVWAPRDLKIEVLQQKKNPKIFVFFFFGARPAHEPEASKFCPVDLIMKLLGNSHMANRISTLKRPEH